LIVLIERAKDNNVKGESRSYTTFVSICAAMVTTMINQMIYFVVNQTQHYEHQKSITDTSISRFVKLTTLYLVNTILVYYFVIDKGDWYVDGGLAELGFYLTLSNLVLANAVIVWMPEVLAWRWWTARSAVVQIELDAIYHPIPFDLSDAYARLVKTIAIGVCFGPFCPMIYLLTLFSVITLYFSWKYALLRNCTRASGYSWEVLPFVRKAMVGLSIIHIAVAAAALEHQYGEPASNGVIFTFMSVSLLFVFFWVYYPFHKAPWVKFIAKWLVNQETKNHKSGPVAIEPFPKDAAARLIKENDTGIKRSWSYCVPTGEVLKLHGNAAAGQAEFGSVHVCTMPPPPPPPQIVAPMIFDEVSGRYTWDTGGVPQTQFQESIHGGDWTENADPKLCHGGTSTEGVWIESADPKECRSAGEPSGLNNGPPTMQPPLTIYQPPPPTVYDTAGAGNAMRSDSQA